MWLKSPRIKIVNGQTESIAIFPGGGGKILIMVYETHLKNNKQKQCKISNTKSNCSNDFFHKTNSIFHCKTMQLKFKFEPCILFLVPVNLGFRQPTPLSL